MAIFVFAHMYISTNFPATWSATLASVMYLAICDTKLNTNGDTTLHIDDTVIRILLDFKKLVVLMFQRNDKTM